MMSLIHNLASGRAIPGRRLVRTLLLIGTLALLTHAFGAQGMAQAANEYQVKAAFILNFAKFVEWPNEAFGDGSSLVVGVLGEDPFGNSIDQIVNGNRANGRRLTIRRLKWGDNLRACQILFIGSSERKRLGQIIGSLQGGSVLTIGDTQQFTQTGGIIKFFITDSRVRFEINAAAAGQAHLKISSKLLALSKEGR
jgi:hypothetical protein